jgi:hypothetical protein
MRKWSYSMFSDGYKMTAPWDDCIEIREMCWYESILKKVLQFFGKLKPDVKNIKEA